MIDQRLKDKLWRLEHLYKIVTKQGEVTRFKLNAEQRKLFEMCQLVRKTNKLRLNILKARQIGVTTFFAIYYLDEVIWNKNRTAAIIAHEREALEKVFRKVKYAWESMPDILRPKASLENKRELVFPDANSSIYIALKIRSGTVQHLHVSEKAYIEDIDELKSGSYQAASMGDITNESTANGLNSFYIDWLNPGTVWKNVFFPWYEHNEYISKELRKSKFDDNLTRLGLTRDQINWYNEKFEELGDEWKLKREYPTSDMEAFETSNRGIFTSELVGYPDNLDPVETIRDTNYTIQVFKPVEDSGQYCLGADPSGGYVDGDKASFYILNSKTRDICLEWHGTISPDLFGLEIKKWAEKYNNSFCGIEVNNHGLSTINSIKDDYSELYRRERGDKITNEITRELGWSTTAKSKDELIDFGRETLRDKDIPSLPKSLKNELRTFVKRENGEIGAEFGCHDDLVMSFLIALMMIKSNPYWEIKKKDRKYFGS